MALNRKNALFPDEQASGHTWAIVQSLVQTCKLNGVEPLAYLTNVLERITSDEAKTSDLPALCRGTGPVELARWNWPGAGAPLH